jgi:hypothetical protein
MERSEGGSYTLRQSRSQQSRVETPETLFLMRKLKELTGENLYLERHLAVMTRNDQILRSMSSKKNNPNFQNDQMQTSEMGGITRWGNIKCRDFLLMNELNKGCEI